MKSRKKLAPADYSDPFRPPKPPRPVRCLHCDEEYPSSLMRWDGQRELWVCKNSPSCDGAGYGIDIHDADGTSA